jgi:hypothetical protein
MIKKKFDKNALNKWRKPIWQSSIIWYDLRSILANPKSILKY